MVSSEEKSVKLEVCSMNGGVGLVNGGSNSAAAAVTVLSSHEMVQLNSHLDCLEQDMKDFLLDFNLEKNQNRK